MKIKIVICGNGFDVSISNIETSEILWGYKAGEKDNVKLELETVIGSAFNVEVNPDGPPLCQECHGILKNGALKMVDGKLYCLKCWLNNVGGQEKGKGK